MTESIVQTQSFGQTFFDQPQDAQCKQVVTHGIYLVCADTGEVIDYDYDKYYINNSEGIDDASSRLNIVDKVYSHYRHVNPFLPYGGIGTIPVSYDRSLKVYSFAFRVYLLISDSARKAVFKRIAQKILSRKIQNKIYILGAFAIHYCNVDQDLIIQLIGNFTDEDEDTIRRKLSDAVFELSYVLKEELDLTKEDMQSLLKTKMQTLKQYAYELLNKYGYVNLLDKLLKLYNPTLIKVAVILLLLKDGRREEAIQLYKTLPDQIFWLRRFIVDYEISGQRFVKKLKHYRLRTLLFNPSSRIFGIKIIT
ncbi:MAG: hypothetical protein L7H13_05255 [Sulfolobales archaeon]|nr:hypothetical protein [Sulfolobales archaeon]